MLLVGLLAYNLCGLVQELDGVVGTYEFWSVENIEGTEVKFLYIILVGNLIFIQESGSRSDKMNINQ